MTVEQPVSFRTRTGPFSLCLLLSAFVGGSGVFCTFSWGAPETPPPAEAEEFADVSLHANLAPNPRLLLQPDGKKKGQALTNYYAGLLKERSGDMEGALDSYEAVLRDAPTEIGVASHAARLAGQFADSERGRKILERTFAANPNLPAAYLQYSEYLSTFHENRKENIARALEVMEQAVDKFPDNPDVYRRLVQLHLTNKDRTKARDVLNLALNRPNTDPVFWIKIGHIALELEPVQEGREPGLTNRIFDKVLQLGKGDSEVETAVGDYYLRTKQYDRSREIFEAIVKARPEDLIAREKLANLYKVLGQDDKMLQTLLELEQINPHRAETQTFIAELYEEREDYPNAVKYWLKAFRLAQAKPEEYRRVGVMLLENVETEGHVKEAIDLLERAQFHYPEYDGIAVVLSYAYLRDENYEKAFTNFKSTESLLLQNDANSVYLSYGFYFSYGAAAERSGRFDIAAELFRKSISLTPDDRPELAANAYNYLGYMWLEQNMNIDEAGELIKMALDLEPESGAYIDSLGWYHFMKADYPKALETLLKAEEIMKASQEEDAVVCDHIGQAYFKLGHQKEAIRYLERALELKPEDKDFKKRLEEFKTADAPKEVVPLDFLKPGSAPKTPAPAPVEPKKPAPPAPAPLPAT